MDRDRTDDREELMNTARELDAVVVGQGYVGLPLAQAMTHAGLRVAGLDVDERVVERLNRGTSVVDDLSDADIAAMLKAGYAATTDESVIASAEAVIICVPTPLDRRGEPDLDAVRAAARTIAMHLRPATLVVLESTSFPGTTKDVVAPLLDESGLLLDEGYWLAFSPERIDPGNARFGLKNTPKVVGGLTEQSTTTARDFYARFVETVVTTRGAKEAETAKLLENTYRHVNIALVNEFAKLCAELDIDVWDVIAAAATKPFGFQPFYPGPGVGGHCIPIDPNYLNFEVKRRLGEPFRFVELAEAVNRSMPRYTVDRVARALEERGRTLEGATVLLLGITYKKDISDVRESPSEPIAQTLLERGASVAYHDPRVPTWRIEGREWSCEEDLEGAVRAADAVVLLQAHAEYDANRLAELAQLFFDTRGVTNSPQAVRL
jgi:UDP-N-acetyl-D-glucosamine dehydrogenase